MKRILATSAILALTTGFASAEITLSGDARMGVLNDDGDLSFIHRARVKFSLSGETDSGLTFGASFRAGDASNADDLYSSAGEVFISGAFGTLTMGDIDNAAQATVGHVDGVGLTGLGDRNEIVYLGDATTSARYDYSSGGLTVSASVGQNGSDGYAVAAAYAMDGYKFSAAYESNDTVLVGFFDAYLIENHVVLGADATFGAVTVKARYGMGSGYELGWDLDEADATQVALSATYAMDALAMTAFYATADIEGDAFESISTDRYGIGASYDLGGGAKVVGGYSSIEATECDLGCLSDSEDSWDLGLSFTF